MQCLVKASRGTFSACVCYKDDRMIGSTGGVNKCFNLTVSYYPLPKNIQLMRDTFKKDLGTNPCFSTFLV